MNPHEMDGSKPPAPNRTFAKKTMLAVAALVLVVGGLLGGYGISEARDGSGVTANTATAVPASSTDISDEELVARIADSDGPSVVQIDVEATQQTPFGEQTASGSGSGVIYTSDGYVITNAHVLEGASDVTVTLADGSTEAGEVVGTDEDTDIAVVKVDGKDLPAASFSDSRDLTVGQLAVAIGSPSGFQSTVTSGLVSGLHRELTSENTGQQTDSSLTDLVQTDAAISPGSSGGALIDRSGQVIGITVAYLSQTTSGQSVEGIGFAIPAYTATLVADQIIEDGSASHPFLGVSLTDDTVEPGALVAAVEKGGPASSAGIGEGDVVTELGEVGVTDCGDVITALRSHSPGDTLSVSYTSPNGRERTSEVTLSEA